MKFLRRFKKMVASGIVLGLSWLFLLLPVRKKRVLFASDTRFSFSGNLKLLHDYLPDDYEKIVILKGDRRIKRTAKESIRLVYYLSTSQYIVLEDLLPFMAHFSFHRKQQIIQLWHGPGAYKRFGRGRLVANGGDITRIHGGYKRYSFVTVSAESIRGIYAEAFGIPVERVHATGFLRTDLLVSEEWKKQKREEIYARYPALKDKKMILFAPTFRGLPFKTLSEGGSYYDFSRLDFDKLYREFHDDYVFVIKWHPSLQYNLNSGELKMPDLSKYGDFYQDLSDYPEINDLLVTAEVLVSDYSSVIFDYVLLDKPIIYFVYDKDEYCADRGIYYPFEDYVYGAEAKTCEELIAAVKKEDMMPEKRNRFRERFMSACDGQSTKKTYEAAFLKE